MPGTTQMTPDAVTNELYASYNAKDLKRHRACWAKNGVYHSVGDGFRREGVDAIMEYVETGLIRPFPDGRATIHKKIVSGDQVVMDVTLEGTHTGPFVRLTQSGGIAEIPPTHRRIHTHAVEWITVKDGKVVEDRIFFDRMEALEQLGMLPKP